MTGRAVLTASATSQAGAVMGDTRDRGRRDTTRRHRRAMRSEKWQQLLSGKHVGNSEKQVRWTGRASAMPVSQRISGYPAPRWSSHLIDPEAAEHAPPRP